MLYWTVSSFAYLGMDIVQK